MTALTRSACRGAAQGNWGLSNATLAAGRCADDHDHWNGDGSDVKCGRQWSWPAWAAILYKVFRWHAKKRWFQPVTTSVHHLHTPGLEAGDATLLPLVIIPNPAFYLIIMSMKSRVFIESTNPNAWASLFPLKPAYWSKVISFRGRVWNGSNKFCATGYINLGTP